MKRKLILSTETFPYGKGEKPFIIPELKRLSEHYDITIVSHAAPDLLYDSQNESVLEQKIKVVNFSLSLNLMQRLGYAFKYLLDLDGWKEIIDILKGGKNILMRIYQSIGYYALAQQNYKELVRKNVISKEEKAIYYTFWFYYYTYSMTKHRKKYKNIKIISRAHGFDLYNERYAGGRQPFKIIMANQMDKLVFISEAGRSYFENVYGNNNAEKYAVSRLGTRMRKGGVQPKPKGECFHLVSCSAIIPLKRIHYIINALKLLNKEKIKWSHFGEGEDYDYIKAYAEKCLREKDNIEYEFKGFVENDKILAYYEKEVVDCFITTSSTEGIPVSIQEAMSEWIPIIATDVGGISEMIKGNGILLPSNPSSREIAEAIRGIYNLDEKNRMELRRQSFELWKEYFWEERNVGEFMQILKNL